MSGICAYFLSTSLPSSHFLMMEFMRVWYGISSLLARDLRRSSVLKGIFMDIGLRTIFVDLIAWTIWSFSSLSMDVQKFHWSMRARSSCSYFVSWVVINYNDYKDKKCFVATRLLNAVFRKYQPFIGIHGTTYTYSPIST